MGRGRRLVGALAQAAGQTVSQLAVLDAKDTAAQRRAEAQEAKEARLLKQRQAFSSEERVEGQEFKAGESVLARESAEDIAAGRAKASAEKAATRQQQEISQSVPKVLDDLVSSRTTNIPRGEIFSIQRRAQEIALEQNITASDAIAAAKREIIDEPKARADFSTAGLEFPEEGTLAQEGGGRTRGERKQAATPAPAQGATRTTISEKEIVDIMREGNKTRAEVLKLAEQKGLTLE